MKKTVLITGGAGFIGSHLSDLMVDRGYKVRIVDNLLEQVHADGVTRADGWPVYLNEQVECVYGDCGDMRLMEFYLRDVDYLIHLAGSVGVSQSMDDISGYTYNNEQVGANILQVLNRMKAKGTLNLQRMAVASSISAYGEGEYMDSARAIVSPSCRSPQDFARGLQTGQWELVDRYGREMKPLPTRETKAMDPSSIYAVNKYVHEKTFLITGKMLGIPTAAMRLFNAYGSRQALSNPYTGVCAIFINQLINDQAPLIFEDGQMRRDFVHVKDVARGFLAFIESFKGCWESFNVGSGRVTTIEQLALDIAEVMGKNIAPEISGKYRQGDIRHCYADISKMQDFFDWKPIQRFDEGLKELVEWVSYCPKPAPVVRQAFDKFERDGFVVSSLPTTTATPIAAE